MLWPKSQKSRLIRGSWAGSALIKAFYFGPLKIRINFRNWIAEKDTVPEPDFSRGKSGVKGRAPLGIQKLLQPASVFASR